ncbi:Peptidase M12B ADAM/reprolysin, partial [Trinorchestia longiramus]
LGAPHDGSSGATSCPASDGYLMSYVANSYKDFYFSSCSSSAMCDIYSDATSSCLKTISNTQGFSLTSNLVGGSYTLDDQCKYHSGKSNAYADTSVSASKHCYSLRCKYVESLYIYTVTYGIPAIEGTHC